MQQIVQSALGGLLRRQTLPLAIAMATVLSAGTGFSEPPWEDKKEEPPFRLVRYTTEMIEVSTSKCDALIAEPRTSVDDSALRNELRVLTAKGEAVLLDSASVTSRFGMPVRAGSFREDITPTEYDPPGSLPVASGEGGVLPIAKSPYGFCFPFIAFETRNVGATLEVDGYTPDDGSTLAVTFTLEWVGRHADTVYAKWNDSLFESENRMPTFYSMRLKGNATLRAGAPTRVGILSPKGPDGLPDPTRKVIVFLRAETLVVPP